MTTPAGRVSPAERRRIYLIGAGHIGLHHARAAARWQSDVDVEAFVADPAPDTAARVHEVLPQAVVYSDAGEMLATPARDSDIVVVATPPHVRHRLAVAALSSGRNVLCEKPLAMTTEEAADMLRAARAANRMLGCCSMRFLGLPPTVEVRRMVREGELGRLYHLSFVNKVRRNRSGLEYQSSTPWMLNRRIAGGGVLVDWGTYDISTINHVIAPAAVEVVDAWATSPATSLPAGLEASVFDVEEHVGATLRCRLHDGEMVTVTYERAACTHGEERRIIEAEGERGAVAWDWLETLGDGSVVHTTDVDGKPATTTRTLGWNVLGPAAQRPLHWFRDRIDGHCSPALVDRQAVFNYACVRAVYEAAASGRPVSVRMDDFA